MAAIVNIDEITPGMKTIGKVYDRRGRFLIGEGVELTEKHIRILKAWGVTDINVDMELPQPVDDNGVSQSLYSLGRLQEAEHYVKQKFIISDLEFEPNQSLFRLCVKRKAMNGKPIPDNLFSPLMKTMPVIQLGETLPPVNNKFLLDDEAVYNLKIPSLPAIFYRISNVINNPRSSSKDIADIVSTDTGLAARLLSMVNSAFYGFSSKIDTVSRAVVLVGAKQIAAIALGIQIINTFKNIPNELINMESFWKHSISCGIAARTIARYKNIANSERMFIGGLLHDLGRLIIFKYAADNGMKIIVTARREKKFLSEAEHSVLGARHTDIGRVLLKKWKLPITIENMVAYHHTPMSAPLALEPAIISLSDIIVNAIEMGSSGEGLVRPISPPVWKVLGLSSGVFPAIIKQVDRQLAEVIKFVFNE